MSASVCDPNEMLCTNPQHTLRVEVQGRQKGRIRGKIVYRRWFSRVR